MAKHRTDLSFTSSHGTCQAWHYRPDNPANTRQPCIVMAHGMGGTRDAGLEPFAESFVAHGFAVFVFDYLYFGASSGDPRQLFSIKQQLADWRNAIACARQLPGVDPKKIALWGTSLSGGHVITIASCDPEIAAVSALAPMLDGRAGSRQYLRLAGLLRTMQFTATCLSDRLRAWLDMSPRHIPLIDPNGGLAVMPGRDAADGCRSIVPPNWRNEICPRYALALRTYRPINLMTKITCPVLIQICEHDELVANRPILTMTKADGGCTDVIQHPCGHFDVYYGLHFQNALENQIQFFKRTLMTDHR